MPVTVSKSVSLIKRSFAETFKTPLYSQCSGERGRDKRDFQTLQGIEMTSQAFFLNS